LSTSWYYFEETENCQNILNAVLIFSLQEMVIKM